MRLAHSLATFAVLLALGSANTLADVDAVKITRAAGTIKILANGAPVAARPGTLLGLPARIETGADGSLRIEQASSTLDIGPSSVIVLPERTAGGNTEKIMQNLGRVLYSVKPRKTRSFAVETPYLVSVVKGTVFSVAIEDDATAVSLLEGSIELVADGIEPVLLQPNESARRGMNERTIHVTKIDVTPPAAPPQANLTSATTSIARTSFAPPMDAAIAADLNEITAASRDPRMPSGVVTPDPPDNTPTIPGSTPDVTNPNTPTPDVPSEPAPQVPDADPTPTAPNDDIDDDDVVACARKKCDSDEDDDRGGGNDDRKR